MILELFMIFFALIFAGTGVTLVFTTILSGNLFLLIPTLICFFLADRLVNLIKRP